MSDELERHVTWVAVSDEDEGGDANLVLFSLVEEDRKEDWMHL